MKLEVVGLDVTVVVVGIERTCWFDTLFADKLKTDFDLYFALFFDFFIMNNVDSLNLTQSYPHMKVVPNNNDKRFEKIDKRSLFSDKRSFLNIKTLPFPGKLSYHLLLILIYIGYELIVGLSNGENYGWKIYLPFYIVYVALFYLYAHLVYPTARGNSDSRLTVIAILLVSLSFAVLSFLSINHIIRYDLTGELSMRTPKRTLLNAIWRSVNLMTLSAVYWLFFHMLEQKRFEISIWRKQQETDKELYEMRIAYENSRINPHFLFNTLQFIYREVESISPKAEEATANLVEIMRYLLSPSEADRKVSLMDEIKAVDVFMDMAGQRFGENFYVRYEKRLYDTEGKRIPPHTILTIAENLVKHGLLTVHEKPATLIINCIGTILTVYCQNYKPPGSRTKKSGIGIQNLKTRLDYFYHELYDLDIKENEEMYQLEMIITL